jgi:hypothetical protein
VRYGEYFQMGSSAPESSWMGLFDWIRRAATHHKLRVLLLR